MTAGLGKESSALQIVMYIWEIGRKISLMGKDYMCMQMGSDTMGNLSKARKPEEAYIFIKVERNSKVNGKKIKRMDLVFSFTLTMKNMKEIG